MSFPRGSSSQSFARARPPGTRQTGPVLAVGRRVLVTGPVGTSGLVTLTDKDGTTAMASVAAGVEVEILAWQPFGLGGTRYRVLATKGGAEGWLGAGSVKARELPPPLEIRLRRSWLRRSQLRRSQLRRFPASKIQLRRSRLRRYRLRGSQLQKIPAPSSPAGRIQVLASPRARTPVLARTPAGAIPLTIGKRPAKNGKKRGN